MADVRLHALNSDDKEQQHLLAALRQPLFIQTPLQALLEHVLQKMQQHSQILSEAWDKVHVIEQGQKNFVDLLARLELMERRVEAATSCRLSPFGQADILLRLEAVEKLAAKTDQHMQAADLQATQDVQPRLNMLEQQLHGVSNLGGRLMALDEVAFELGVPVHELDAEGNPIPIARQSAAAPKSKLMQLSAQHGAPVQPQVDAEGPQTAAARQPNEHGGAEGAAFGAATGPSASSTSTSSRPATATVRGTTHSHRISSSDAPPTSRPETPGNGSSGEGGAARQQQCGQPPPAASSSSLAVGQAAGGQLEKLAGERPTLKFSALQEQIDALRAEHLAMAATIEALKSGVAANEAAVNASEARAISYADATASAAVGGLEARVTDQMAVLRRDLSKPPEVSLAEFCKVQSAMAGAQSAAATAAATAKQLEEKELPGIRRSLAELQRRLGRALGVRDADKALSDAVLELRGEIDAVRAKVDEAGAAVLAAEGVATQAEVQEMMSLMRTKANKEDLKSVMGRAVELALESYRTASGDSSGTAATRFKCLTCNRDIADAPSRSSPPRIAPAADEFRPSGSASGPGPMGPGLNAAHLRRLAEERMFGDRGTLNSSGTLDTGGRPSTASPGRGHQLTAEQLSIDPGSYTRRQSTPGNNTARLASKPGSPNASTRGRPSTAASGAEPRSPGGVIHKGRPVTAKGNPVFTPVFL